MAGGPANLIFILCRAGGRDIHQLAPILAVDRVDERRAVWGLKQLGIRGLIGSICRHFR